MVGRREMHHCALCSDTFTTKAAYNQHLATHEEPANMIQWPCPVCPFKFNDSYALETHKAQTGHSGEKYTCDRCGKVLQTQSKFKQHSQFPSSCYADAPRTRPIRNNSLHDAGEASVMPPTQTHGRPGSVDMDTPGSAEAPVVLPYDDPQEAPSRSPTPSDVSGVYCHDCKRSFNSMALYNRHCLSCTVQRSAIAEPRNTSTRADARSVPSSHASNRTAPNLNTVCGLDSCTRSFKSKVELGQHQKDDHDQFACGVDGCETKLRSQIALEMHRKVAHVFLCDVVDCIKPFRSESALGQHKKSCHPVGGRAPSVSQPTQSRSTPKAPVAPVQAAPIHTASAQTARPQAPKASPSVAAPPSTASGALICGISSCPRVFKSEAAMKQHKMDSHGVGGRGLDLRGKDSWMLSQSSRNQLENLGLYRPAVNASQPSRKSPHAAPPLTTSVPRHIQAPAAPQQPSRDHVHAPLPPAHGSKGLSIGLPADIDQANDLQDKFLRLRITADIAIHHDGKLVYDGVDWIRVGVDRQQEVASRFDELVHFKRLNKHAQANQHVSHPAAFAKDSLDDYPRSEFEQLPEPRDGSQSVVVLCCTKVSLENKHEEVVKIAAVDVLTGRPLMSYLVCTSATERVRDWRTSLTGLSSFQDLEAGRAQGFQILKGWTAARAALGKFVDQNTIILGYNLRSDLDALRIRHGRCVDLVKLIEKTAENRPLSKKQLRLDAFLRDLLDKRLPTDRFGRDCLQDAFAMRGFALFFIKHNDKFAKYVKDRVRDYAPFA